MSVGERLPEPRARGGCLCGAVRFAIHGELRPVINCHCEQCRRWHGHYGAYTSAARADVVVEGEEALRWFDSSNQARRGFCGRCGSSLFFERHGTGRLSIAAGSLDLPTGLVTERHWYVGSIADYYRIADNLPRVERD